MTEKDPAYPPQENPQQGYPQQYGYPQQQAYAPPQQGYPPQQPGYPPQQQGYAPSGYHAHQAPPPGYPGTAGDVNVQYKPNAPTQTVIVRSTQGSPPNNYMAFAIFVTCCCCLPFGIVAIIKASEVENYWRANNAAAAETASQAARKWSIIGLVTGIVAQVIGVIFFIVYYVLVLAVVADATSDFNFESLIDNSY